MAILTPGERRALKAVKQGDVTRAYDAKGNRFVIHPNAARPHPSAAVLWRLERAGMLRTLSGSGGVFQNVCSVEPTDKGCLALAASE